MISTVKKPAKEGSKSEKLIHGDNSKTLKFYKILISSTSIIYSLITYFFLWPTFTTRYCVLSVGAFIICLAAYKFMAYMATPSYGMNDRGVMQLQDAGLDLNIGSGGIAEHAKDSIIICCVIFGLSLLHRFAWFILLFLPARLFHMLWVNILSPWIFDPNQEPAVNEKKQQKLERKMRRVGHLTNARRG